MPGVTSAPDPSEFSDQQLKARIRDAVERETRLSAARSELHSEIDALREELVRRLRADGTTVIRGADVDDDSGLSGVREPRSPEPESDPDGALAEPDDETD
jgi:hypothetical protein